MGMQWDGEVVQQSARKDLYAAAFQHLLPHTYPCSCTRREVADSRIGIAADGADIYPGTCRNGLIAGKPMRTLRLHVPDASDSRDCITFEDRWLGPVAQHLAVEAGDFVLKRADGFWAYQLAVVVDDAEQGVTDIVRGADLLESTPRQIYLQRLLDLPTPTYLHAPVVRNEAGEKLSKQTGATMLDLQHPLIALITAARLLGLPIENASSIESFWPRTIAMWRRQHAK